MNLNSTVSGVALAALGPFQTPSITFQFTFTDCHSSEKLVTNSFLITKPLEIHAYKFIKNTKMLILSKGLRGGKDYEKDTFRKKII